MEESTLSGFLLGNLESITILVGISAAFIYVVIENVTHWKKKSELLNSFSETVRQLSSPDAEMQLSAAILLRRYLNIRFGIVRKRRFLFDETVNVIS